MGREAAGVRGVRLSDEQRVNRTDRGGRQGFILTASQNGFGKLTPLDEFPKHGRGGQGVIALQITDRNGKMVGALQVSLDDEIMLMSQNGVLVRTPVKDISVVGRNTQGVRLIRLEEGDLLSGLERIEWLGAGRRGDSRRARAGGRPGTAEPTPKIPVRVFNFSPGPAVLPLEVLERAQDELPDWHHNGMSVMEVSHRSKAFLQTAAKPRRIYAS